MGYKCRDKQTKKRKRGRKLFAIFLVVLILGFVYLELVVNPVVVSATTQTILSLSSTAVSDAVFEVLNEEGITYNDLVSISYNNNGDVSVINFQSGKINLLARKIYQKAQENIETIGKIGIYVPLGAFTGLPFLSGFGPRINLKMVAFGAISSVFENTFNSVGINQTNHTIHVNVLASVNLLLPAYKSTIDSVTEVLVAQCVIVGKVPDAYLGKTEQISFAVN